MAIPDTEKARKALKVGEIRDLLEEAGLDTAGTKPVLLARLEEVRDAFSNLDLDRTRNRGERRRSIDHHAKADADRVSPRTALTLNPSRPSCSHQQLVASRAADAPGAADAPADPAATQEVPAPPPRSEVPAPPATTREVPPPPRRPRARPMCPPPPRRRNRPPRGRRRAPRRRAPRRRAPPPPEVPPLPGGGCVGAGAGAGWRRNRRARRAASDRRARRDRDARVRA